MKITVRQGRPEAFDSRGLPVDGEHSPRGQEVERIDGSPESTGGRRAARASAGGDGPWWLLPLGVWAAVALPVLACSTASPPPGPSAPVTLTIGLPQVSQIDPSRGLRTTADQVANERLTASDAQGRVRPLLLDRWSVSADGLVWRLTLRSGLRFHDGSAVTTADIVRAIEEGRRDPATGDAVCLQDIAGVAAVGDRDVDVTLTRRCFFLLDDLLKTVTRPSGQVRPGSARALLHRLPLRRRTGPRSQPQLPRGPAGRRSHRGQVVRHPPHRLGGDDARAARFPGRGQSRQRGVPRRSVLDRSPHVPRHVREHAAPQLQASGLPVPGSQAGAESRGGSQGARAAGPEGPRRACHGPDVAESLGAR